MIFSKAGTNYSLVLKALGLLLIVLSIAMLLPLFVAIYLNDGGTLVFSWSVILTFSCGILLYSTHQSAAGSLQKRGAFLLVTVAWFSAAAFGGVPFYISGTYPSLIDAFFESASGFTTTGATVLAEVESLPHSILLWRSLTQFLGGMGIIVLSLAILPLLGVGGMDLYRAEAPGPTSDKISARVSETARALWIVYVFLAALEILILYFLGLSLFDSVNHTFTTMATGGFSTKNTSVGSFDSAAVDVVITVFMFLAGMNFLLHYRLLVRRDMEVFRNRELRFYTLVIGSSILVLSFSLWGKHYSSFLEALRYASFQVVSLISTTGYGTADYLLWGPFAHALLLILMVIGGCSGSTGGGIKCVRVMLLIKQGIRELKQMIHPQAVIPLKLGNTPVPRHISSAIFGFFFLYMLLLSMTTLIIGACGVDVVTAFSATVSALSNVGPALGQVGPMLNYGHMPDLAKVLLSVCMIVGRLEILTVLVLFTGEFWRS